MQHDIRRMPYRLLGAKWALPRFSCSWAQLHPGLQHTRIALQPPRVRHVGSGGARMTGVKAKVCHRTFHKTPTRIVTSFAFKLWTDSSDVRLRSTDASPARSPPNPGWEDF